MCQILGQCVVLEACPQHMSRLCHQHHEHATAGSDVTSETQTPQASSRRTRPGRGVASHSLLCKEHPPPT